MAHSVGKNAEECQAGQASLTGVDGIAAEPQ